MTKKSYPLVSVVMATYNDAEFIEDSILSVLKQDFGDFEFIIINDGSTDKTPDIIAKLAKNDNRIIVVNQKNQGLVKSLNNGIALAKGKYIARIDGDDQWLPHKLATQVKLMQENSNLVLISGGIELIDQNSMPFQIHLTSNKNCDIRRIMTITNPLVHSSFFFKKDAALKYGGYPDACPAEDYALASKMLDDGEFYIIPYPIIRYRVNPEGISQKNRQKQDQLASKIASENWEKFPPEILSRKEIKIRSQNMLKEAKTLGFGESLKYFFLTINSRIGYRMIQKGNLLRGVRQLWNIASTGRTALKIVVYQFLEIIKNKMRANN